MTHRISWTLFLLLSLAAFGQKKGKEKPPEVELVEVSTHRQEGIITFDAHVKNVGEKSIKGLQLVIDFVASDHKQVVTTKRGSIEASVLDPGEDADFHAQVEDPSRATEFKVHFEDVNSRYLRGDKTGPFPIE